MADHTDIDTVCEALQQIRGILTVIVREAGNRGVVEIAELAERADRLAEELMSRKRA
jgi:hypothetical protein